MKDLVGCYQDLGVYSGGLHIRQKVLRAENTPMLKSIGGVSVYCPENRLRKQGSSRGER